VVQNPARLPGGSTRGCRRSRSSILGAGSTTGSTPNPLAIERASFWRCSSLGSSAARPQPQKLRRPDGFHLRLGA
jgi:hypothetical protein